ncbi:lachesin-like [Patiria miniata]|uniref:Ig-like domain-containing protein n=1 Tax=Patiria miniata TaxID=46514 RepID=A0A914APH2_PATMI|nr:lachesin-like [Patiria miniata]
MMDLRGIQFILCLSVLSSCVVAQISIQPLTDLTVNEGNTVLLDCALRNIPGNPDDILLILYHDGKAIVVNKQLAVNNPNYLLDTSVVGHWKLTIQEAQIEDQGTWSCQVQLPNEVSQQMRLVVLAAPVITSVTPDMAPMPGSMVTLWCNATGSPEPSVTWTRQRPAGNLPSGVEFVTGNPLVISDITNDWRGLYQCFVTNGIGQGAVTAPVFLQMEYSPIVRALNELVAAPIGDSAQLQCIGESFPAVKIVDNVQWFKDDRLVGASDGYQMSVSLDMDMDPYRETSIATLIVTAVSNQNVGKYTCRLQNLLGSAQADVRLEVGKQIDPETGASRSKASNVMAAMATIMAAIFMATVLVKF